MEKYYLENLKVVPSEIAVRELTNLSVSFSINFALPKYSSLGFRFRGGRNNKNDWYYLQTHDSTMNGFTQLIVSQNANLIPLLITGKELSLKFMILEEHGLREGSEFQLNVYNTLVQSLVEKRKKIDILIEIPNQNLNLVENPPSINVINNKFDHITLIAPSITFQEEKLQILVRIHDKFKNLVKDFLGSINLQVNENSELIEFKKEHHGLMRFQLPSLKKKGIYKIRATYNGSDFYSNPIICKEEKSGKLLYWGYIHGHTNKSDGIRDIEEYFENLINAGLDFGTSTEHDHLYETTDGDFEDVKNIVRKYTENNKFVSIFGYEYGTWYTGYGDICIYYKDDDIPIFRSEINKYNSTSKLIKSLKQFKDKVLMIAHHTALRSGYRNWDYFDNSLEKLVEIYSTWGNQEYRFSQGNPIPPRYKFFGYGKYARKRGAILERKNSFVSDALQKGYKLGFTAGGDDHFGIYPSGSIDPDNGIYPPGIMAVWAENLSKKSIWEALNKRKCYGTTGPRAVVEFYLENFFMGDIIDLKENSSLEKKREIRLNVISPLIIERIEIIRNNIIILKEIVKENSIEFKFIDDKSFEDVAFNHSVNKNEKFVFYYLRIFLLNNNMAWSTPIWIVQKK